MTRPWLTIVTVVKDDLPGFVTTATSIAEQDLSDVEYLVVDSSSRGDSIAEVLAEPPLSLSPLVGLTMYSWEPPSGIYEAMNSALSKARGRYILFLNAGDRLVGGGVLDRARSILTNIDAVWGYADVEIEDAYGTVVRTPPWDFESERAHLFARGHFPCHQGTFVSTDALRQIGGFDTRFTIAADYASFLALTKISGPIHLDFVLARFIEGGASTVQWRRSIVEFHKARRRIMQPRGAASALEYVHTMIHFMKLGTYRGLVHRWRT